MCVRARFWLVCGCVGDDGSANTIRCEICIVSLSWRRFFVCLHPNITFFRSNFRLTCQDLFPVHFNPTCFARTLFTGIIDFDSGRCRHIPNPLIRDDTLDDFSINFTFDRHRSLNSSILYHITLRVGKVRVRRGVVVEQKRERKYNVDEQRETKNTKKKDWGNNL